MLKRVIKTFLIYFYYFLYKTPHLKGRIIYFVKKFPFLEIRLKRLLHKHIASKSNEIVNFHVEILAKETFRYPLAEEKYLLSQEALCVFSALTNKKGLE